MSSYIALARPKHWLKNVFVLAPLVFAGRVTNVDDLWSTALAFCAFNLIASAIYVINDIFDASADKLHPRKCKRPIPSGRIAIHQAYTFAFLLALGSSFLSLEIYYQRGIAFAAVTLAYFLLSVFYSIKGKHIIIVDAFCIAVGFVLRVIAGACAIDVEPTGWIVVTTFFLALFLGFGKRRNEIAMLNADSATHRQVLKHYHLPLLDQIVVSTGTISIISYALYTLDHSVTVKLGTDKLIYTIPFVAYGVFRYIYLLLGSKEGDPTEVVTSDKGIVINIIAWAIAAYAIVYFSGGQFK